MPTAYGYCRASTGKQNLTFDVQKAAISAYYEAQVKQKGYDWGGFFEDHATSGRVPFTERDEGKKLWALTLPGDAIIWHKIDRAFRSVVDGSKVLSLLKEKKIAVHSIDIGLDTSTALGEFVSHLLLLLAQLERSWISSRTKDAIAARRLNGGRVGVSLPAGYKGAGSKGNRELKVDTAERMLLDEVYTRFMSGEAMATISNSLYWKEVHRTNKGYYHVQWLCYAMTARSMGYPQEYTFTAHKEKWKADRAAGIKTPRGKYAPAILRSLISQPSVVASSS